MARRVKADNSDPDAGPYVGEINNLNSAGFYAYDVGKMVAAIEAMAF